MTNPGGRVHAAAEVRRGVGPAAGLPASLVYPWHKAFAPRCGIAWRVPKLKQTVVRGGFGMNYTVGEYATFANDDGASAALYQRADQPRGGRQQRLHRRARAVRRPASRWQWISCAGHNWATMRSIRTISLPYVQVWNLDIQKTLPWGIVMNVGYNGSKGEQSGHTVSAPRAMPSSPADRIRPCLIFNYERRRHSPSSTRAQCA